MPDQGEGLAQENPQQGKYLLLSNCYGNCFAHKSFFFLHS